MIILLVTVFRQSISLLFFNKTEEDIWCRQILESMVKEDDRYGFK